MLAGNPYSVHQAHLNVGDLEELGYLTRTLGRKSDPSTWCHILAWNVWPVLMDEEEVVVVYTAVFGDYDNVRSATFPHNGRHVCITDGSPPECCWEVWQVERRFEAPQLEARMYKTLAHQWFPEVSYSVWHDGNMRLKIRPDQVVQYLKNHDLAMFAHPERDCAYEEAAAVLMLGKAPGNEEKIRAQVMEYKRRRGYPAQHGLAATGLVVRRHTEEVARFNDAWWSELVRYSNRDQMSVNYVLWRLGMDYSVIPGNIFENEIVDYRAHGIGSE